MIRIYYGKSVAQLTHFGGSAMSSRSPNGLSDGGTGIQPMVSDLTIRNWNTGVERLYHAGHASSWVAEFSRDLQARVL
jgi:hypothetical protein